MDDRDKKFRLEIPQDRAAEGGVIGSVVLDPECLPKVFDYINAEDFFTPEAKRLFEIITSLWEDNEAVDAVMVRNRFPVNERVELFEYLEKALETVPSAANAVYYARLVKRKSTERKLYSLTDKMITVVQDDSIPLEEKIEAVAAASVNCPILESNDKPTDVKTHIADYLDELNDTGGLTTGFSQLDRITDGLLPGQLILIAGRPGIGKSSCALDMFIHHAKIGARPYLYSLEMAAPEIVLRILKNVARQSYFVDKNDPTLRKAGDLISKELAWIEDKSEFHIDKLCMRIVAEKEKHDIGICFIDYLQLIQGKGKSLYEQTTDISRKLKLVAKRTNIPIIALCQLNRACELRNDHRPVLSDLRDSGSLEQDADIIMFLHRDDYYRKKEDVAAEGDGEAELLIAKNRRGQTGIVNLVWLPQFFSFGQKIQDDFINNNSFGKSKEIEDDIPF